ncbi:MAG: FkbM family methyltransferase [Bacteroidia bacterium]|nr:FkbM family methyltransferase [Bacteroidia bacterium]MDW8133668.1 FkbM family methyltransferase [Bacteroidia bacterium]
MGKNKHPLYVGEGSLRLCQISPPNLYGFLHLRKIGLSPVQSQPPEPELLAWELLPGRTFLTRLHVGMDLMTLYELFGRKDYGENFSAQTVVDVGAYNGDSAVFFALQGAHRVIALEPYPPNYALAQENLRRMELEDRITLIPAALGVRTGKTTFRIALEAPDANSLQPSLSSLQAFISYKEHIEVEVLSLPTLRERFGLDEIDFLKLDCEGCEFSILSELPIEEIRRVKVWHIEYHGRPLPLLKRLTEAGYAVERRLDRAGVLGYLIAKRR